jgi:hypothetical protein
LAPTLVACGIAGYVVLGRKHGDMSATEHPLEHFELHEGYACYRPMGEVSLREAKQLVSQAIVCAREQRIPRLLVNTTQLTGFASLSITDRFYFTHEMASQAGGEVKVAGVTLPERIPSQKFGATVGFNIGFRIATFTSEPEALQWLLAPK